MNKFKKIMLGALSVLTLGLFVVTGTKANAAVNNSFTFDLSQFAKIGKNTTGETSSTATDTTSGDTMTLTLNIPTALTGSDSKWDSSNNCYIVGIKSDGTSATFTLSFTMEGSGQATFTYNTGGGSKYVDLSVDSGTATQIVNGGTGTKVVSGLTAGDHTFTFTGTSSSTSNFKLYSFVVTDSYETGTAAEQAVEAINAIPSEITYTTECKALIDTATTKIAAVADDDKDDITNLATYNAAVTSFNNLESTKISAFTTAVTSIGTVTASSGSAIEAAQAAYDALLASTKANADVISAKADLDAAIAAYDLIVYNSYSKSYVVPADTVYEKDKDNKSVAVTYTEKTQLGNSIFYATNGMAYKDEAALTIGETSWDDRLYTGGNSTCNSTKQERVVTFETKTSGTLKIAATSQNNTATDRTVNLYNSSFEKTSQSAQIADSNNTYMYFDIPAAGTYYLGSTGGVNFFYMEFIPETTCVANDVTLTFDAQYNEEEAADSTKLRFIGTIDGIAYKDYANISSIKFTFKFKGTERTTSVNNLYKSIINGETTVKAAADNKMYVIYQLNNINKTAYQTEKLTDCKFIVTFTDGSTVSVNRADITLPTTFTSVVA